MVPSPAARTLSVRHSGVADYLDIRPHLETTEQYEDAYAAAYNLDYSTASKPTEGQLERRKIVDATELIFVHKSDAQLREIGGRIIEVLAEKHNISASFEDTPTR